MNIFKEVIRAFLVFFLFWILCLIRLKYRMEPETPLQLFLGKPNLKFDKSSSIFLTHNVYKTPNNLATCPVPVSLNEVHENRWADLRYSNISMAPCSNSDMDPYDVLIIVKTSRSNHAARMRLRRSWANSSYLSSLTMKIKYGFIVGMPTVVSKAGIGTSKNLLIKKEALTFKDIIEADFVDTYRNLTYKTMAGFGWATKNCPHFRFYISVDDDVCISLPNIIRFLKFAINYTTSEISSNKAELVPNVDYLYAGHGAFGHVPFRGAQSKYFVSREEYAYDTYPAFVSGWFVILSKQTVRCFYAMAPFTNMCPLEDVYMGMLANKTGVRLFSLNSYVEIAPQVTAGRYGRYENFLAVHNVNHISTRLELCIFMNRH